MTCELSVLCSRVPLYQARYSTIARRAMAGLGQACKSISSPWREASIDWERALSQHWPVRPRDSGTPLLGGAVE